MTLSNMYDEAFCELQMDIWVIGTLNQIYIKSSYTEINFSKL